MSSAGYAAKLGVKFGSKRSKMVPKCFKNGLKLVQNCSINLKTGSKRFKTGSKVSKFV